MCEANESIPEGENDVFVGEKFYIFGDETPYPDDELQNEQPRPKIRIFFTSKRLLRYTMKASHVAEDTTFKLT